MNRRFIHISTKIIACQQILEIIRNSPSSSDDMNKRILRCHSELVSESAQTLKQVQGDNLGNFWEIII
ncbi:MAG: hypothetical protein QME51_02635 [Planctomycetota bacterium]|nr:hypothetical protein [Planctomycetota bacterium]MDI6787251.1 hypothetical protein [Planctomycetota bacterium]